MIQHDVIKLESVVECCNRVNSQLLVIKFMQHVEINIGSVLEYI